MYTCNLYNIVNQLYFNKNNRKIKYGKQPSIHDFFFYESSVRNLWPGDLL